MDPAAYEVVHDLEESHWFFVAKRRILSRLLDEMLDGTRNPRILDVGCGTGATMGFLERYGEVTGVDISPQAVQYGREQGRARLCLADGVHLPFVEGSIDQVTVLDLGEHLGPVALREMWRVLKCEGHSHAGFPSLWNEYDRFSGHYRRHGKEELRRKIKVGSLACFDTLLFLLLWGVQTFKNRAGRWHAFRSGVGMPVSALNGVLAWVFSPESGLTGAVNPPFGASMVCWARKDSPVRGVDET